MITALFSLYSAGILMTNDVQPTTPHLMPWDANQIIENSEIPKKDPIYIAPVINAKAAIAVDLKNGYILYEKNIHNNLPIASLTKLMTAIIVLEENNTSDVVKVTKNATRIDGSKIWLAPDEKITVENLLYAALIPSANDAAMALAQYNGDSIPAFVSKMNKKSEELGMVSTFFVNPTGLREDEDPNEVKPKTTSSKKSGQDTQELINPITLLNSKQIEKPRENISTAYDLTLLARYAYGKSFIRRAAVKKELEISSTSGALTHKLKNTNELLSSYLHVLGLKTGTTDEAGECLISIIEDDNNHQILTVVLNSPSRYTETKVLADWVFRSYHWNESST